MSRRPEETILPSYGQHEHYNHKQRKACNIQPCKHHLSRHLSDDRKEASRPKKKFLAADVRKMHDILSRNMYKIRQKVIIFHTAAIFSTLFIKWLNSSFCSDVNKQSR